jgi:outer membrane protein assembly factor BamA
MKRLLVIAAAMMLLSGCYVNKYIPEGQHRLKKTRQTVVMSDGSEVSSEVNEALKNSLQYYSQRSNSKFLGISWLPVSMWTYGTAHPSDNSFFGNYWRRMGQAPVVYDAQKAENTVKQLEGLLEMKGCFGSKVTFDTVEINPKKISIAYHITATPRYRIHDVDYRIDNDTVRRLVNKWSASSLVRAGDYYDQEKLRDERTRLVSLLREEGYYYASVDNVSFLVDTAFFDNTMSITVNVDCRNLRQYHINDIYIYPNSTAGLRKGETLLDTLPVNYAGVSAPFEYKFVYQKDNPGPLGFKAVSRAMMLFPGSTYRPRYVSDTYNSLLNLRNFKYINIEFSESPYSTDSVPLLDAHVRLINATQQKLSLSLEVTNASPIGAQDSGNFLSNGNLGIETSLEYQHKNIFGGAELLKIRGSLLLESPKLALKGLGESFHDMFSAFEATVDASLDMPDFLLPFKPDFRWHRTRPHTLVSLGGSYQYRHWYERILANTSFGYTWNHRFRNRHSAQHQLLPFELTFVNILNIDDDFAARLQSISDLRMKYQYSSHFIMNARYDFSYSTQEYGTRQDFSHFSLSLESAGNLLSAVSHLIDGHADSNAVRQLAGVPFSQYVRLNTEFTHYFYHTGTLVVRALLGMGIPYGNSVSMPYEKSFFGGGPTTMRAWQLRHLGPGSFQPSDDMFERVGDLQLVLNVEERFPIGGIFEGALFADAGNVWLFNPSDQYPGGEFKPESLLKEIAVGAGLGLRVNVTIATLRLDVAIPLYDPGYESTLRWRIPHLDLDQLVFNFGINYPF